MIIINLLLFSYCQIFKSKVLVLIELLLLAYISDIIEIFNKKNIKKNQTFKKIYWKEKKHYCCFVADRSYNKVPYKFKTKNFNI